MDVSQISSENGPHSNVFKIFLSDRSEAQMFCGSFNNLTVLAVLMESAHSILLPISTVLIHATLPRNHLANLKVELPPPPHPS